MPLSDDSDYLLIDTISSEDFTDNDIHKSDMSNKINMALVHLSDRESYIIKHLFGIGVQEMTLGEIANVLDLTSERVRQIKNSALKKLSKTGLSDLV